MGVALKLSLGKRLQSGIAPFRLYKQIFRRTVLLYVLGLVVYAAPGFDLSTQRILGVLQRIAICYLIASVIYLHTSIRGQIVWAVGFLVAYWLMMTPDKEVVELSGVTAVDNLARELGQKMPTDS